MATNNTSTVSASNHTSTTVMSSKASTSAATSSQKPTSPIFKDVLHAVKRNDLDAVKHFIEVKGEPITTTGERNRSIALIAAEYGHLPILKYILTKNSTLSRIPDIAGNTVLQRAIEKGDLEMVKCLVEEHKVDILTLDHHINTAVHVAALEGQLTILKYFIEEKGAEVNIPNINGEPPIFLAAEKPYLYVVMYLVEERHADPKITDLTKDNILYKSAKCGDVTVPKYLLDTKKIHFDIDWKNTLGYTVINWASRFNHTEFVKYMVEQKKADVHIGDTKKGRTPLHYSAIKNNLPLCKFLIEHGAKFDAKDLFGFTAIQLTTEPRVQEYLQSLNTSTKSNRKRRNVIDESLNLSRIKYQAVPMTSGDSYLLANPLGGGREMSVGDLAGTFTSMLDGFLMVVDTFVRYATGSTYRQGQHESLLSPREHLRRRMDTFALYAIRQLPSKFEGEEHSQDSSTGTS